MIFNKNRNGQLQGELKKDFERQVRGQKTQRKKGKWFPLCKRKKTELPSKYRRLGNILSKKLHFKTSLLPSEMSLASDPLSIFLSDYSSKLSKNNPLSSAHSTVSPAQSS